MSDIAGQAADAAAGVNSDVSDSAVGSPDSSQGQSANPVADSGEVAINPAWNKMLEGIPSSLHPMVTPHLKEWDGNFQKKLHEVQSQYAPFEAFKDTPPEQLEQAVNFYKLMEANPEAVYQQMAEFYGFGGGDQGQQGQENSGEGEVPEFDLDDDEILSHPRVKELLNNQEVMAQYLVQQQEKESAAQFEKQIDTEISQILEANPGFDDADQTLMFQIAAASNISLTDAAKQVTGYAESLATRNARPSAPSVMGAGGFVPAAQNVDPATLDGKGTRKLVADLIEANRDKG